METTDLEMMQRVAEWPHLAGLPLKRKDRNPNLNENFGLLVCPGLTSWPKGSKPSMLVGANVWNPDSFKTATEKNYETLEGKPFVPGLGFPGKEFSSESAVYRSTASGVTDQRVQQAV